MISKRKNSRRPTQGLVLTVLLVLQLSTAAPSDAQNEAKEEYPFLYFDYAKPTVQYTSIPRELEISISADHRVTIRHEEITPERVIHRYQELYLTAEEWESFFAALIRTGIMDPDLSQSIWTLEHKAAAMPDDRPSGNYKDSLSVNWIERVPTGDLAGQSRAWSVRIGLDYLMEHFPDAEAVKTFQAARDLIEGMTRNERVADIPSPHWTTKAVDSPKTASGEKEIWLLWPPELNYRNCVTLAATTHGTLRLLSLPQRRPIDFELVSRAAVHVLHAKDASEVTDRVELTVPWEAFCNYFGGRYDPAKPYAAYKSRILSGRDATDYLYGRGRTPPQPSASKAIVIKRVVEATCPGCDGEGVESVEDGLRFQFTWKAGEPFFVDFAPPFLSRAVLEDGYLQLFFSENIDPRRAEEIITLDGRPVRWLRQVHDGRSICSADPLPEGTHRLRISQGPLDLARRGLQDPVDFDFDARYGANAQFLCRDLPAEGLLSQPKNESVPQCSKNPLVLVLPN